MLEFLQTQSSLPSLHPAIIHFPIALIALVWLLRLIQVIRPRLKQVKTGADVLIVLAALGGGGAWLSGREAVNLAGGLSIETELAITRHADLAAWAVTALVIAALIPRICALARDRLEHTSKAPLCRWVNLLAASVALVIVGATADLGGALVYTHGVGVKSRIGSTHGAAAIEVNNTISTDVVSEPLNFPDGRATWQYTTGVPLEISVDGSGLLELPGLWGDSVIESVIDPGEFEGSLTLVHYYSSPTIWEGFEFTTEGTVRLLRATDSGVEVRDETSLMFFRERFSFRSSAVNEHFKGLVDDDVVVHGHGESGPRGRAGLLITGVGHLTIISLEVSGTDNN